MYRNFGKLSFLIDFLFYVLENVIIQIDYQMDFYNYQVGHIWF